MKTFDTDTIYGLLPLTVRMRDQAQGGALYALVGVIAGQANIVDDNLYQLYDDLFIETCSPWAIPYIGDLIGYRLVRPVPPSDGPSRADVADTIGLRRRKGTVASLAQLARDVTGWPAVAVEYFDLLAVSQYVRNHVRPGNACVDVHAYTTALEINGAFDLAARSLDVRRIESGRGRYNVANVGLFVWRLQPFGGAILGLEAGTAPANKLVATTACTVGTNMYTFDPFGGDVPLVNPPQGLADFSMPLQGNVPFPLRRFPLYDELDGLRNGTIEPDRAVYFGASPVFAVYDGTGKPIPPQNVAVCDLSTWQAPTDPAVFVAVDPELGRLTFNLSASQPPTPVRVSHAFVFSGPIGGGSYARTPDPGEALPSIEISDFASADSTLWNTGVIEIDDSGILQGDVTFTPAVSGLVVRAEDFARPVVAGNVTVIAIPGGSLTLRGLGIAGNVTVALAPVPPSGSSSSASSSSSLAQIVATPSEAFDLNLEDCTIRGTLQWTFSSGGTLQIERSLCGALYVDPSIEITIADSVIDAGTPNATTGSGPQSSLSASSSLAASATLAIAAAHGSNYCGELSLSGVTVFGDIRAREIGLIENSIVMGSVVAQRTQAGCLRYSYLLPAPYSQIPPSFRCQPDLAITTALAVAAQENPSLSSVQSQEIGDAIQQTLVPVFTSHVRGDGAYAQLAQACPVEISSGAESSDEMGAFHSLYAPRREGNLQYRLAEYLRIGLEAGIVHAS